MRCLTCDYPLDTLPTPRCPECGRDFDPANPASFHAGRPLGNVGRRLLRPLSWRAILLTLPILALLFHTSRWPISGTRPRLTDTLHFLDLRDWSQVKVRSTEDHLYTAAVAAFVLLLWLTVYRLLAATVATAWYRTPWRPLRRRLPGYALAATALWLSAFLILYAWPYRVGRAWVRTPLSPPAKKLGPFAVGPAIPTSPPAPPWAKLTASEELLVLRAGLLRLPDKRDRTAALKFLAESRTPNATTLLLDVFPHEPDAGLRAAQIHVVALCADPRTAPRLDSLLASPHPETRAAAADALGLVHGPAYPIPVPSDATPHLATDPPILVPNQFLPFTGPPLPMPPARRGLLHRLMLTGATSAEREAAARALLLWPPPNYELRVAEWGVWSSGDAGQIALIASQLAEIPPFVHRTGDPIDTLGDRYPVHFHSIFKPIIHLTANVPLPVDLRVVIHRGRPWFAYPMPDDWAVWLGHQSELRNPDAPTTVPAATRPYLADLDPLPPQPLAGLRAGYPWIHPHHAAASPSLAQHAGYGDDLTGAGMHWQSLIVSPAQLPWMKPAAVGTDPKFQWWQRLRAVPASWVSSRGESDRFLYYDGPTFARYPLRVRLDGDLLQVFSLVGATPTPRVYRDPHPPPFAPQFQRDGPWRPFPRTASRSGFLVRVGPDSLTARHVPLPPEPTMSEMDYPSTAPQDRPPPGQPLLTIPLSTIPPHTGPGAIAAFRAALTSAGLTPAEAAGLLDCWEQQFFYTPGTRFLLIMSSEDYDAFCPLRIRPAPTELARVGILLTELPVVPVPPPAFGPQGRDRVTRPKPSPSDTPSAFPSPPLIPYITPRTSRLPYATTP